MDEDVRERGSRWTGADYVSDVETSWGKNKASPGSRLNNWEEIMLEPWGRLPALVWLLPDYSSKRQLAREAGDSI